MCKNAAVPFLLLPKRERSTPGRPASKMSILALEGWLAGCSLGGISPEKKKAFMVRLQADISPFSFSFALVGEQRRADLEGKNTSHLLNHFGYGSLWYYKWRPGVNTPLKAEITLL